MNSLFRLIIILFLGNTIIGCEQDNIEYDSFLIGTWVDQESNAMQFVDFYSDYTGRFGTYYKNNLEKYSVFKYKLTDNQLTIEYLGDAEGITSTHEISIIDKQNIEISDLTDIPENPDKIYLKREIVTEKSNDTIILKYSQIYFNPQYGYSLMIDSVINDSRCPVGAECFWEGSASVLLDLKMEENHYKIELNTNTRFRTDTVIKTIRLELTDLSPYPVLDEEIEQEDYIARIVTEKLP